MKLNDGEIELLSIKIEINHIEKQKTSAEVCNELIDEKLKKETDDVQKRNFLVNALLYKVFSY